MSQLRNLPTTAMSRVRVAASDGRTKSVLLSGGAIDPLPPPCESVVGRRTDNHGRPHSNSDDVVPHGLPNTNSDSGLR